MSASHYCIQIKDDDQGIPVEYFSIPNHYKGDLTSVLISAGLIQDRIEKLAKDICADMGNEPIVLLCVLKGGYRFFHDLLVNIQAICRFSEYSIPMSMEFIRIKSYENDASTGNIKVSGMNDMSELKDKNVLIIEDIIDTGLTMQWLLNYLKPFRAKKIKVASLLVKRTTRSNGYRPDYAGFEVPDHFLVGYALDYNEHFRDLCHICVLNQGSRTKYEAKSTAE